MHHKPRAYASWRYGGKRRPGSVAYAFHDYDDSIPAGPSLEVQTASGYRIFCGLARDLDFRRTIYSNSSTRYCNYSRRGH